MQKGDSFKLTFHVNDEIYNGFISTFNDRNPLHTDKAYAVSKGFNDRVMFGNILNGFLSYFIGECLPARNTIIQKQEIQFHKPVYLNDEVELQAVVNDVFGSVNSYEFKYKFFVKDLLVAKGKIQIGFI